MQPIKTLLVDDEFLALQLLEEYCRQVPDIEIVDKVKSPIKALEILQEQKVDLLFLDIQMPILSGTHLLKALPRAPLTVFTTAYNEYALEAYDLNAIDYLLKPFPLERFLKAVQKARQQLKSTRAVAELILPARSKDFFTIKADGNLVKIHFRDIHFIEGLKEYVRIVCGDNRWVTLESLKNLEEVLPQESFIRVHKSYIVAKDKVQSLEGNQLVIDGQKIPLSRGKREEIVQAIFYQ